jgi:ABC-type transport system substrate-binding protein
MVKVNCFVFVLLGSLLVACGGRSNTNATGSGSIVSVGVNQEASIENALSEKEINDLIASHTDAQGRTFISVALEDDPGSMNPYATGASKPRQVILEGIFEGMFCIQGTGGELKPVLAESYTVSPDGLTYTIKLKNYIYDSKGNHFSAKDVKFVLEEVARGEYKWASMLYVEAINIPDDYTLQIKFKSKNQKYIIDILIAYLFTEKSYVDSRDKMITNPVGTGPYALTTWISGSEMIFETYGTYWEKDPARIFRNSYANVDKIIYKIIKEAAQRVIAMEAKTVDMCTGVAFTDLGNFQNDNYSIFKTLQDQVVSIAFNCSTNSPCNDLNFRKAIAYAIDNKAVMDGVDQGNGEECFTAFANVFPDYDKKWETEDYYNYNVEKAKELLKNTSYSGKTLTIMFESPNDRLASVAQVIQAYLLEIGVKIDIFPCDGALFRTYRFDNTKADLLMFSAGSSTFGSSGLIGNLNAVAPDSTLIGIKEDTLMRKMDAMADNAYIDWSYAHEFHYYVKDNLYIYSLYAPYNFTVTSRVVTGFLLNQKGKDSPNCCAYIWNKTT